MNEGAYIVEKIRARCVEDVDCWKWTGYCYRGVMPMINLNKSPMAVRRAVWLAVNGPIRPGYQVVGNCETANCVNPEHLRLSTLAARVALLASKQKNSPKKKGKASPFAKLSFEKAREIRASNEKNQVLAERYGVSSAMIGYVQRGQAWVEVTPFAGLGARA